MTATVTPADLLDLATVEPRSLLRDASVLVLGREGVTRVPSKVVEATLAGRTDFVERVLYYRELFADDGIETGRRPHCFDGSSLAARLEAIADELNRIFPPCLDADPTERR